MLIFRGNVMQIYFYVYKIEKEECEFVFTYLKNDEQEVYGIARVELDSCPIRITFDPISEACLNEKEKRSIISEVLTNINI